MTSECVKLIVQRDLCFYYNDKDFICGVFAKTTGSKKITKKLILGSVINT